MQPKTFAAAAALALTCAAAEAEPALMAPDWAQAACQQWNRSATLMEGLAGEWIRNDGGKGHKVIQLYRSDCGESSRVELRIGAQDGKARCVYGGKRETAAMDTGVDYTMHATTARWSEMGKGDYGPMRAMMLGRLEFTGPKMEAMGVMGPFEAFLLLVGQVPGTPACPGG